MHQTALDLIIHRFADFQKEQIERLYLEDATFREICQDYAECVRMRDRYADDPTLLEAPLYERDYEMLIEALEEEMHALLLDAQSGSSSPGRAYAIHTIEQPFSSHENHESGPQGPKTHLSIHPSSSHLRSMDREDKSV